MTTAYDEYTVAIDDEPAPVFQIDTHDDGRRSYMIDVVGAVDDGFDFSGVWGCKTVTVDEPGETYTGTVECCTVDHGAAALVVRPEGDGE